jgi:hypothetical protein
MTGSSSVATILASSVAAMKGPPTAAALLAVATTNQQCGSVSFAADIDGAEKGIRSPVIDPNDMKRASTAKRSVPPPPPAVNLKRSTEAEQASSTGASRYAEVNIAVESSIEQELDEGIKGWEIMISSIFR